MRPRASRGCSSKSAKVRRNQLLNECRNGNLTLRAECDIAWRRALPQVLASDDFDISVEAEVGQLLEHEMRCDVHHVRVMLEQKGT